VSEDLPDINLRNNQTEISVSISQDKIKNDNKVAGGNLESHSVNNSISIS